MNDANIRQDKPDFARSDRLLKDARQQIESMPTGPGKLDGRAGVARSQTRQIKKAMAMSNLLSGASGIERNNIGQSGRVVQRGYNQLANTELQGQNQIANTEKNGQNQIANTSLHGQNQRLLSKQNHQNTMQRDSVLNRFSQNSAEQQNRFNIGSDNRSLAIKAKMSGINSPEVQNLYNTTGDFNGDISAIQFPGKQDKFSARTLGTYDDSGQKVNERLIGMNENTGQFFDYGGGEQGVVDPGAGVDQSSILEQIRDGKIATDNLTPDMEAKIIEEYKLNPGLYEEVMNKFRTKTVR